MINKNNKQALVQLAGIVYSGVDDNINQSKKSIIRKIIQLSMFQNGNKMQTVAEIATSIKNTYGLVFLENEIWDIIDQDKGAFYINNNGTSPTSVDTQFILISLSLSEYTDISARSTNMSLNKIIDEFYHTKCNIERSSLHDVTELILNFIYNHFVNNLNNYSNLIQKNSNRYSDDFLLELKSVLPNKCTIEEEKIINDFIEFEDTNKNRYIFYIITLALEYSLTLNLPNDSIPNKILIKSLYIDTNIIFTALGIDGVDKQNKILIFLDKCLETKQNLFITTITESEFEASLKFQCKDLDSYNNVSAKSYGSLATDHSIVAAFLNARQEKPHLNSLTYRASIQTDYECLKKKYNIQTEYIEDCKKKELVEFIASLHKYKHGDDLSPKKTCEMDVCNLDYISNKTTPCNNYPDVLFITIDRKLLSWAKTQSKYGNISIMPSDWLAFMLRFISRSDNEYESFVGLLKITPINEIHFEPHQIATIIQIVNDVEEDPERQEIILNKMIENNYDDMKTLSNMELDDEFVIKTDSIVSAEINSLHAKELDILKQDNKIVLNSKDETIEDLKSRLSDKASFEKKFKDLEDKLTREETYKSKKKEFKKHCMLLTVKWTSIIVIAFILFVFLKPYILKLFKIKDESIGTSSVIAIFIWAIPALGSKIVAAINKINLPTLSKAMSLCSELKAFNL